MTRTAEADKFNLEHPIGSELVHTPGCTTPIIVRVVGRAWTMSNGFALAIVEADGGNMLGVFCNTLFESLAVALRSCK